MNDAFHFGLFIVGVFALLGAFMVGIGAFEYEVVSLGEVEKPPDGTQFTSYESQQGFEDRTIVLVTYDSLSPHDQRIVDRAIAGERLVFRRPGKLPGKYEDRGKFAVMRDGGTYLINRRVFFNWRTTFGVASIALGFAGLAAVSESIRRRHFPHRTVFWTR